MSVRVMSLKVEGVTLKSEVVMLLLEKERFWSESTEVRDWRLEQN